MRSGHKVPPPDEQAFQSSAGILMIIDQQNS
jgi:hypothetical protein